METTEQLELQVSEMAKNLVGSEIIKLAGEIKAKIAAGEEIYNMTIGDFNPEIFPIPDVLKEGIIQSYKNNNTNYPPANGIEPMRKAVSRFLDDRLGLHYDANDILIAGGARPLIYAVYQALIDPNDKVVFPVPSWNNNHYTHLSRGQQIVIETTAENNFMPTIDELAPYIEEANLIALCSPLNPTGTVFGEDQLRDICLAVVKENERRAVLDQKPLYLLYDQIYWVLTHGETRHVNPASLVPEMRNYTVFIDGLSKCFAATGVRVGWAFGPQKIIGKMRSILGHIGAWSPKAEQVASADFIQNKEAVDAFLNNFKQELEERLVKFYEGFKSLKSKGFTVDAIAPQAAIYLTVNIDIKGKKFNGKEISSVEEATQFILDEAGLAIVPFYAFGTGRDNSWYRLSVGTAKKEDIPVIFERLERALAQLD